MSDETTNGVLIKGADGTDYFIPQENLSKFAIPSELKPDDSVTEDNPKLAAFEARGEPTPSDDVGSFIIIGAEDDDTEPDDSAQIIGGEDEPDADDSSQIIGGEDEPGGGDDE